MCSSDLQREKVSAKEVLNRKDLQTFHDDLDKHLKEKLPFYEKGILNDKTLPFENVEQVKRFCCKVFQKIYFSVKLRKKTERTE